jgi:hypothetical protein
MTTTTTTIRNKFNPRVTTDLSFVYRVLCSKIKRRVVQLAEPSTKGLCSAVELLFSLADAAAGS